MALHHLDGPQVSENGRIVKTLQDSEIGKSGLSCKPGKPWSVIADHLDEMTPVVLQSKLGLWRPHAGLDVLRAASEGKSVLVRGRAGCGKGAALTAVWQVCKHLEVSHVFFDAHYRTSPAGPVLEAFRAQARKDASDASGGVVCLDSLDYFYAGNRKGRGMAVEPFRKRVISFWEALRDVPVIVGTIHEEGWRERLGDEEMIRVFEDFFRDRDHVIYDISEAFETTDTARAFLVAKGLSREEATLLTSFDRNARAQHLFNVCGFNPYCFSWNHFRDRMREYAILKLITQDVFNEHIELLKLLRGPDIDAFYRALFFYVAQKDFRLTFHPIVAR